MICGLSALHAPRHNEDHERNTKSFKIKDDKIEEPKTYLGAGLSKMTTDNGTECWSMSSGAYCKAAVTNVETKLRDEGRQLPSKCDPNAVSVTTGVRRVTRAQG